MRALFHACERRLPVAMSEENNVSQEPEAAVALLFVPPLNDIRLMLTLMNTARSAYAQAQSRAVRKLAERQFNHCYDWFTNHRIAICYDAHRQHWRLDTRGTEVDAPYVLTEAIDLGHHDVLTNG